MANKTAVGARHGVPSQIEEWGDADFAMMGYGIQSAQLARSQAALDNELALIRARHQPEMAILEERLKATQEALKKFAKAHKSEFKAQAEGGQGRTRIHAGVEMGFALTPPYVSIAKKKFDAAIAWLREFGEDTYVRYKPELAKDRIKADLIVAQEKRNAEGQAFIDRFAGHGITLDQDDDFVLKVL